MLMMIGNAPSLRRTEGLAQKVEEEEIRLSFTTTAIQYLHHNQDIEFELSSRAMPLIEPVQAYSVVDRAGGETLMTGRKF
jgi:hypothetical protein